MRLDWTDWNEAETKDTGSQHGKGRPVTHLRYLANHNALDSWPIRAHQAFQNDELYGGRSHGGIRRNHGGSDGGRSQGEESRDLTAARKAAHGGADGGRSPDGGRADNSRGPTDSSGAGGRGDQGGDRDSQSQGDAEDPKGQGRADGSGDRGADRDTEGCGRAGATENQGRAGEREEPNEARGTRLSQRSVVPKQGQVDDRTRQSRRD
ncbi:Transcription elongation factor SPT5 [Labeo rohita]|uniref:Transcription elongation factor SPT5 n=1 Tax=Labeo rohita TaxID=84645 RepID=A0ABQ8LBL5_LABRO|nr:Transcription elongation factor SPT5 [Labeo rohita]